jgi:hypothetical protein
VDGQRCACATPRVQHLRRSGSESASSRPEGYHRCR